jgi:putative ABC transport system permease protein
MARLLFRHFLHQPSRTLLTCAALGGVIALLLLLTGFERGLDAQLRRVALDRGADLILVQAGMENFTGARSALPQWVRARAEQVDGVEAVHPMTGLSIIYEQGGRRTPAFLFVHDSAGGPVHVVRPRPGPKERGIILDKSLARKYGLAPGDTFTVSGFPFEIQGLTSGAAALFTSFAYIHYDALIDFYFEADLAEDITAFPLLSYLLVTLAPGNDREAVARELEAAVPEADVFTPEALAQNDARLGDAMFGSVLGLLETIGALIGVLVVAMLMFAAVAGRLREMGILKAIGFNNGRLFRLVVSEALLLTAAAVPVGMVLAETTARLIGALQPQYLILPLEAGALVRTLAVCAGFAVLGALAPMRWVGRIDPARVFQP